MKAHVAVYELRIVRLLASLLDANALMSNRKRGTLKAHIHPKCIALKFV